MQQAIKAETMTYNERKAKTAINIRENITGETFKSIKLKKKCEALKAAHN